MAKDNDLLEDLSMNIRIERDDIPADVPSSPQDVIKINTKAKEGQRKSKAFSLPEKFIDRWDRFYHGLRSQGIKVSQGDLAYEALEKHLSKLERKFAKNSKS